jgi:glycosyltransferase involved in cell wall biosynthesis
MACGSPVVISDQVNIWREVQALKAGIVVGLYPRVLADAICQLLSDKNGAKTMGTRGRIAVKKHFNLSRIIEQQIKMYQVLINRSNHSSK